MIKIKRFMSTKDRDSYYIIKIVMSKPNTLNKETLYNFFQIMINGNSNEIKNTSFIG